MNQFHLMQFIILFLCHKVVAEVIDSNKQTEIPMKRYDK